MIKVWNYVVQLDNGIAGKNVYKVRVENSQASATTWLLWETLFKSNNSNIFSFDIIFVHINVSKIYFVVLLSLTLLLPTAYWHFITAQFVLKFAALYHD